MKYFLTGTDTGVGKTHVAAAMLAAWREAGHAPAAMKPICCGDRDDAVALHAAIGGALTLNDVNPVWLRAPTAPFTAALIENRMIDLDLIRETFARTFAGKSHGIVEGIGGWRVPIARDYDVGDLAADLELPVAIVVANRLGALNHAFLTRDSIRARGLECAGLILNHVSADDGSIARSTNRGIFEELGGIPILAEYPFRS